MQQGEDGAFLGEFQRDRGANSLRRAGDHGDLVLHAWHGSVLSRLVRTRCCGYRRQRSMFSHIAVQPKRGTAMKITHVVPWLVRAAGTFWGEYFFVEVRTDEGVTGWGEITTTTKTANRAVAGIIRQLNDLLIGEDPSQIERLWHKTFRSFTYPGSRGATTNGVSGIDIALWDIRGKVLAQPIYDLLGGKVRDDILLYTHPNSRAFSRSEA